MRSAVVVALLAVSPLTTGRAAVADERFFGDYALSVSTLPGYRLEIESNQDGDIVLVPSGENPIGLKQISATRFRLEGEVSVLLDFVVEGDGPVERLELTNLFGTRHYRRTRLLAGEVEALYRPLVDDDRGASFPVPERWEDELRVGSIEHFAVEPAYVRRLIAGLERGFFGNVNSLLVAIGDRLVVEAYFNGWSVERPHQTRSISKSVASLLVGSAIGEGFIGSVDDPIGKYLPDYVIDGGRECVVRARYFEQSPLATLGFRDVSWSRLADGRQATAFGLALTPRDFVKLGQLVLRDGRWEDKQVLPPGWIAA